jgi:hypothetical protein
MRCHDGTDGSHRSLIREVQGLVNLFVYGKMVDQQFLEMKVLERPVETIGDPSRPCVLRGFTMLELGTEVIFPAEGHEVRGRVMLHLFTKEFSRIDRFQGTAVGFFVRRTVTVHHCGEEGAEPVEVECEAYVGGRAFDRLFEREMSRLNALREPR